MKGDVAFVRTGFQPGDKVRRKGRPDWGGGVVQSVMSEEPYLITCWFEGTVQGGFQFSSAPENLERSA